MNAVTRRITPAITTMIRMDHTHVLALFHRFKVDSTVGKKRALVTNACLALQVHAQLEEEIFYPALRTVIGGDTVLAKSEPEHDEMRRLIADLRERAAGESQVDDPAFDETFMNLMRVVIHHVADEETCLLPAAERLLDDRLGELGLEMTRRRVELLKPHAGELAASAVRSFPGGAVAGLLLTAGAVAIGTMLYSLRRYGSNARRSGRHRI
jgi:hemerythrin superfamily protein